MSEGDAQRKYPTELPRGNGVIVGPTLLVMTYPCVLSAGRYYKGATQDEHTGKNSDPSAVLYSSPGPITDKPQKASLQSYKEG